MVFGLKAGVFVLLSMALGVGSGEPSGFAKTREIAEKMARAYRRTEYLSLHAIITEEVKKPGGEVIKMCEKARADVMMARGGKLRLTVTDSANDVCVLHRVCDGKAVTDWDDKQLVTFEPADAGDVQIDVDFNFCYVGSLLSSWLGHVSRKAYLFENRIGQGKYKGIEKIEGNSCYVVVYDRTAGDNFLVRE